MGLFDQHGQPGRGLNIKHRRARSQDEMIGLCKGVIADGLVCEAEARFILGWFEANPEAAETWPGNTLAARLAAIWEDGVVTPEELADLKELMGELTGLTSQALADLPHNLSAGLPLDKPEPEVAFKGSSFCFTGKMVCGPRKVCEEMTRDFGGTIKDRPAMDLDYMVIGLLGSRDWKHSSHGTKILTAVEYRDKGRPIKIISEETWLKAQPGGPKVIKRTETHPPRKAPETQADILALLTVLTPEHSKTSRAKRSRIPLAEFPYSPYAHQPGLAANWYIPLDKCFSDQIDFRLTQGDVNKEKTTHNNQEATIETTNFYWTQGGDFCFQAGDVIWLDRDFYQWGTGPALQIISATPAISANSENKRNPGSITAGLYRAEYGRNVREATLKLTQDELVRTLITGDLSRIKRQTL